MERFFDQIALLPPDPILGLPVAYAADPRKEKVNLGIGAYKTAEGLPLILNCVKKAEALLLEKETNKDYLPIDGDPLFVRSTLHLIFGNSPAFIERGGYFSAQTVGGASALRLGGEFLAKEVTRNIFISQPTWSNHKQIFERAGLIVGSYPYCSLNGVLDFEGMLKAIENMPPRSAILLHASCHNPTGIDPSKDEWKILSEKIEKGGLIPFFDVAYQGFGKGIEEDVYPLRLFAEASHEMLVAYSYSKNLGLYGERIGSLTLVLKDNLFSEATGSQIKVLIRSSYSNPPLHGAKIAATILRTDLRQEWFKELTNMRERVDEMRKTLASELAILYPEAPFSTIQKQVGLFCFIGISPHQVEELREKWAIYIPSNGRINLAGLNTQNLPYVAKALASVLKG